MLISRSPPTPTNHYLLLRPFPPIFPLAQGGGGLMVGYANFKVATQCRQLPDITYATVALSNTTFARNKALSKGGALLVEAGTVTLQVGLCLGRLVWVGGDGRWCRWATVRVGGWATPQVGCCVCEREGPGRRRCRWGCAWLAWCGCACTCGVGSSSIRSVRAWAAFCGFAHLRVASGLLWVYGLLWMCSCACMIVAYR